MKQQIDISWINVCNDNPQTTSEHAHIVRGTELKLELMSERHEDLMCDSINWIWHIPNATKNVFMNVWILLEVLIKYLLTLLGLTNLGKALMCGNTLNLS